MTGSKLERQPDASARQTTFSDAIALTPVAGATLDYVAPPAKTMLAPAAPARAPTGSFDAGPQRAP
jgi:hypothetical protein